MIQNIVKIEWYRYCWVSWVCLTYILYYEPKLRDLGPSYDIYDYNPDDNMGIYLTIGPFLLPTWMLWTWSADLAFISSFDYFIQSFLIKCFYSSYWYFITIYSFINVDELNFFNAIVYTNLFILYNFIDLWSLPQISDNSVYETTSFILYNFIDLWSLPQISEHSIYWTTFFILYNFIDLWSLPQISDMSVYETTSFILYNFIDLWSLPQISNMSAHEINMFLIYHFIDLLCSSQISDNSVYGTTIFILYNFIDLWSLPQISDMSVYETTSFILYNFIDLWSFSQNAITQPSTFIDIGLLNFNMTSNVLWFPWDSFFNYLTVLSVLYILTFLSIYNTENNYYVVLYLIFLVFLFASTLVIMDLDIFAGLLVLIESVVVLMLFFLIIYLTPNITLNNKNYSWKLTPLSVIFFMLLSLFSYFTLSDNYYNNYLHTSIILDDFYEALHEVFISELTGVYVNLYWTNSLLLLVIGVLLLVASVICVVLVSFFTKLRTYNYNTFLDLFDIAKVCYSFIFLRKQNLSKQGRSVTSTRIFGKKIHEKNIHSEYKEKYELHSKQDKK